jgi:hypothetical protein
MQTGKNISPGNPVIVNMNHIPDHIVQVNIFKFGMKRRIIIYTVAPQSA